MEALIVATIKGFIGFEINDIKLLQENGYKVTVACNTTYGEVENKLNDVEFYHIPFERNPFCKENIQAYKELKKLINKKHYEIIHCHTPVAGILTRLAAKHTRKRGTKVIYTAHGFHFYKGAPLKNWLLYYPIEWICSWMTDVLITINKEDYKLAQKHMHGKKSVYIPGVGVNIKKIQQCQISKAEKRKELGIPKNAVVLISTGELNENKNHKVIVKALEQCMQKNIYYIICGVGKQKEYLIKMSKKLKLEANIKMLGYRNDIDELLKVSDIFVFPSLREGLGLSAIEAMAAGLPLITSRTRGINDYSINGKTGFSCNAEDIVGFQNAILKLADNDNLRQQMGTHNKIVAKQYDIGKTECIMKKIYKLCET